jgi:K+-transporting ATPase ATPase A chain
MARIFTTDKHWRVERGIYKTIGVNPANDQKWSAYVRSMLAFSLISVLFLYGVERLQHVLLGFVGPNMSAVQADTAWNTAVSFVTNTNWQNYAGESTMNYLTQMSGLAVQNFMSAAVGIVVAIAMIRGFMRSKSADWSSRPAAWWTTSSSTTPSPRCQARTRRSWAARSHPRKSSRTWETTAAGRST